MQPTRCSIFVMQDSASDGCFGQLFQVRALSSMDWDWTSGGFGNAAGIFLRQVSSFTGLSCL
jgi:hypothetical protein